MEALRAALTMVLGIVLPLGLQLYDRRRLPPQLPHRSWGYATWGSALYAFGPLSMMGWIFVTRRPWRRCLVAVPYTMAPLLLLVASDVGLGAALGEPVELAASDVALTLVVIPLVLLLVMLLIEVVVRLWRFAHDRPMPEASWPPECG